MTIEEEIKKTLLNNLNFTQNYPNLKKELLNNPFTWKDHSRFVAQYCPQHFGTNKYNWKDHSRFVAQYCPQHFDPNKYNWKKNSWAVIYYCPEKLNTNKAYLSSILITYPEYKNKSLQEIKQQAILNKV